MPKAKQKTIKSDVEEEDKGFGEAVSKMQSGDQDSGEIPSSQVPPKQKVTEGVMESSQESVGPGAESEDSSAGKYAPRSEAGKLLAAKDDRARRRAAGEDLPESDDEDTSGVNLWDEAGVSKSDPGDKEESSSVMVLRADTDEVPEVKSLGDVPDVLNKEADDSLISGVLLAEGIAIQVGSGEMGVDASARIEGESDEKHQKRLAMVIRQQMYQDRLFSALVSRLTTPQFLITKSNEMFQCYLTSCTPSFQADDPSVCTAYDAARKLAKDDFDADCEQDVSL